MKVSDLLVLGPVVNATGELKIQLPGRNGKIRFVIFRGLLNQCFISTFRMDYFNDSERL